MPALHVARSWVWQLQQVPEGWLRWGSALLCYALPLRRAHPGHTQQPHTLRLQALTGLNQAGLCPSVTAAVKTLPAPEQFR